MDIINRTEFEQFAPWSGAKDTWDTLKEFDKLDDLEAVLEDLYPDGVDETTLNDILWFETESVYEWVGLFYCNDSGEVGAEPVCCCCCGEHIPALLCATCNETSCKRD